MQLDAMAVRGQPGAAVFAEVVAGPVVDDEEELPTPAAANHVLQEDQERGRVEDGRELVEEARPFLDGDGAEDMGRLARAEGVDARLLADRGPGAVQRAIQPEAGLVAEGYDTAAGCGFFLIAGSVVRSQYAWRSRSARASRLRGRCTEKPS